jgi:type I restriction enzyme, S subunit
VNAERLLQLYDRVSEAPDAIPRLRRFVLDLAVRGKLVEQDPKDEPAAKLLNQLASGKSELLASGVIRKPRELYPDRIQREPFSIPASWSWVPLERLGAVVGGGTPSASNPENFADPGEGIPWLTPADLGGYAELFISRGKRDLTESGLQDSSATLMPAGAVLFTSRAPIGYVAIAKNDISTNQGFKSVVPYIGDCSPFIAMVLKTFAPDIDANAPGTTFKEVSGKLVAGVPFPLAPLAEQRRIVAKVDELMALCDSLEAEREKREATRDRLTTASLSRLTAPDVDEKQFKAHADFAIKVLPELTTRPDQIKVLRQTILDLAVRGKLVEQDPNDEPVLYWLMRSPYWIRQAHVGSMGTTVHTLTIRRSKEILVPLPPIGEQSRIALKVAELMGLCDSLVDNRARGQRTKTRLLEALLLTALEPSINEAA